MKKSVLKWYAAATLMLGAPWLSSCAGIMPRSEYRIVPNLVVNTDNSYGTAALKSEEAGIEDEMKLAKNADFEESWDFLPDESLWIETGRGEVIIVTFEEERISYFVFQPYVDRKKIYSKNKRVTEHHYHPAKEFLRSINEEMDEKPEEYILQKAAQIIFDYRSLFASPIPSGQDIFNAIKNSLKFYKKQPDGKIRHKVSSIFGVTEYSLTEEGRRHFSKASDSEIVSFANEWAYRRRGIKDYISDCVVAENEKHDPGILLFEENGVLEYYKAFKRNHEVCLCSVTPKLQEIIETEMATDYIDFRFTLILKNSPCYK